MLEWPLPAALSVFFWRHITATLTRVNLSTIYRQKNLHPIFLILNMEKSKLE